MTLNFNVSLKNFRILTCEPAITLFKFLSTNKLISVRYDHLLNFFSFAYKIRDIASHNQNIGGNELKVPVYESFIR